MAGSENEPIVGKPVQYELEFDGCTNNGHCHRQRSLRQEGVITEDGKRRVCHRPAGWGTESPGFGPCKMHGGNAPTVRRLVQRQIAESAVQTLGLPQDVDPAQALLDEVRRTAGHVAWLQNLINAMEADELVYGMVEETIEPNIRDDEGNTLTTYTSGKYKAQPNVWYQIYQQERRHLVAASKAALDAGINERIVKVYEQIGDQYISMLEEVLSAIGVTQAQRVQAWQVMYEKLQAITGGTDNAA